MDRDSVGRKGYWIAAPTPFTAVGALNESALRSVLRLHYDQGVHGVLVNGTTGELFSETEAERRRTDRDRGVRRQDPGRNRPAPPSRRHKQ